ncbi:co-chaperone GroES [bacterium]|nr:co-chaperone GroES [bacterium]
MFQKLRPLSNHVWVELIEKNEKTQGGIYIPDAAKEKTQTAKVLATGPGKQNAQGVVVPLQVKVGDTIFFGKFSGVAAGDKFMVLKEDDILGVIEE